MRIFAFLHLNLLNQKQTLLFASSLSLLLSSSPGTFPQFQRLLSPFLPRNTTVTNISPTLKDETFNRILYCKILTYAYIILNLLYLRSIDKHEKRIVRLLCAKSKVAPLKIISIPGVMYSITASEVDQVAEILSVSIHSRYLWCDSTIILA